MHNLMTVILKVYGHRPRMHTVAAAVARISMAIAMASTETETPFSSIDDWMAFVHYQNEN